MNKITKKQKWPKPISFGQAKKIIRKLNHEAPIMDALLASGSKQVLMQLVKDSNRQPESQQEPPNIFDKIIHNHKYEDNILVNRQSCSFLNYKKNPQKNSSSLIASRKISYTEIKQQKQKNPEMKSYLQTPQKGQKPSKNRIVTMPNQLRSLKQQLLSLPIISTNKKKSLYLKTKARKQSKFLTDDSLFQSGLDKEEQHHKYRYLSYENEEDVIERFSPIKSIMSSRKHEKSVLSQGNSIAPIKNKEEAHKKELSYNVQKIIDIMEQGKKATNIKAARMTLRDQLKKLKNAGQRLSNFMNFQNYPSERAMKLMNQAIKIQKSQQKAMERETLQVKNNEALGEKYKMMVAQQRNRYKNNVRQFTEMKKKHKISLIRIEAIAELGKKKPDLHKEKTQNIILSQNFKSIQAKNQLQQQGKKLNCSLCTIKSN